MRISIIIPTYNRANTLTATLSSILKQPDLEDVEVIVVDNGSTDNTALICRDFAENISSLQYLFDAEPGLLTGRHLGASTARGEILCFLDDDVELTSKWISGVKDAFSNPEVQLATGPCLPNFEITPPAWLEYFWLNFKDGGKVCSWLSLVDLGNKKKFIDPNYIWGLNFCIRSSALYALGGFHPDSVPARFQMFQGDGESGLTIKASQNNYKAFYHTDIALHHNVSFERLTLEYFKKRAFYQGVCNSFTYLKQLHSNKKEIINTGGKLRNMKGVFSKFIHLLKLYKLRVHKILFVPKSVKAIEKVLTLKEKEGYNYHQEAFKNNDKVKKWVLKNDYWNYKLPL